MRQAITPALRIQCLGNFKVGLNGEMIGDFETDKSRALLVYLAVEADRPHQREHLAGLLWSDIPERRALQNLRQTLLYLRKTLQEDRAPHPYLIATRETVQLNPEIHCWMDIKAFEAELETAYRHYQRYIGRGRLNVRALQQGLAYFQGEFLEQFYLNGGPLFDEWASLQRVETNRRAVEALALLSEYHERRGETALARQAAARLTSLAPWDETAHTRLMRLLAIDGQWSAAQNQYAILLRYLSEELGVEPVQATVSLFNQIREASERNRPLLPTLPPARYRLPDIPTSFVGRAEELNTLSERLSDPECRLLTLLGPGGIGKTRLAIEAAREQVGIFPDGVYLVPLIPVEHANHLVPAIAAALGMEFSGTGELQNELVNYLRGKELLLVLDNFEHLLSATPEKLPHGDAMAQDILLDILQHAPGVTVLITSRSLLNLRAECVFELGGLDYPSDGKAGVDTCDAFMLFDQSARRVQPHFKLADHVKPVTRICQLLEGNPLGIELSASWVRLNTPASMVQQIEQDLSFLATNMRDVPERHRSLRVVFSHSWDLLNSDEQQALSQLAVFHGGFTVEAGVFVTNTAPPTLAGLIDHSLLRQDETGRYNLHPLVKQFAAEKLAADTQLAETAAERHALWYARFLAQRTAGLKSLQQQQMLEEIAAELENSRGAWNWLVCHPNAADLGSSAETLYHFYNIRSLFQEGIDLFAQAAKQLDRDLPPQRLPVLAKILAGQGALAFRARQNALASAALERAGPIFEHLGLINDLAFCLIFQAGLAQRNRAPEAALEIAARSLALYRQTGDVWGQSYALFLHGLIYNMLGKFPDAQRMLHASLEAARAAGDQRRQIAPLNALGDIACHLGEYQQARQYFEESLAISQMLGDRYNQGLLTMNLGTVSHSEGRYPEARQLYQQSLDICRDIGDEAGQAMALANMGELAVNEGHYADAVPLLQRGMDICRALEDTWTMLTCLVCLGEAELGLGEDTAAQHHLREGLHSALEEQSPPMALQALLYLGQLYLRKGETALAEQLLNVVIHHENTELRFRQRATKLLSEAGMSMEAPTLSLEQATAAALA